MTKRKKKHIDKALREAVSTALRSQPDPAPGWTAGDSEILDQPVEESAHGAPLGIAPLTLEHGDETQRNCAPPENIVEPGKTQEES